MATQQERQVVQRQLAALQNARTDLEKVRTFLSYSGFSIPHKIITDAMIRIARAEGNIEEELFGAREASRQWTPKEKQSGKAK
jgi:hypothetical protein